MSVQQRDSGPRENIPTVSMREKLIAAAVTAVLILMFCASSLRTNRWS